MEATAHDLAEVRKLIEGMNALVSQQQQQQLSGHQQQPPPPSTQQQQRQHPSTQSPSQQQQQQPPQQQQPAYHHSNTAPVTAVLASAQTSTAPTDISHAAHAPSHSSSASPHAAEAESSPLQTSTQTQNNDATPSSNNHAVNGIIVEVEHLAQERKFYLQLAADATIEPLIVWLRMTFNDLTISGMVLQYKGFDGLWKCLLNRDDSLKRVLKQTMKASNTMLQMRVPREQDLLSSGYTDRRLIDLTKPKA